jgi:hypothetical protein
VAIALDTLAYAKRLREAGFCEQQMVASIAVVSALVTIL